MTSFRGARVRRSESPSATPQSGLECFYQASIVLPDPKFNRGQPSFKKGIANDASVAIALGSVDNNPFSLERTKGRARQVRFQSWKETVPASRGASAPGSDTRLINPQVDSTIGRGNDEEVSDNARSCGHADLCTAHSGVACAKAQDWWILNGAVLRHECRGVFGFELVW